MLFLLLAPIATGATQYNDALIIQGHSPVVLLVIDPYGHEIGCINQPCTSTSSSYYVDTIPAAEGPAYYNFASNLVYIAHPYVGSWMVKYVGTGSGTFSISAGTCNPYYCNGITISSGSTNTGLPGNAPFILSTNGGVTKCNPYYCP
jgi:hypothetical protein